MTRGISINIGLNRVSPEQYDPPLPTLRGCEKDARAMNAIAQMQGFEASLMLGEEATRANAVATIGDAAATLTAGDIFLLTFSGHGSQLPDEVHGDDEDGFDETMVLYDLNLIDDELYALWGRFAAGVRILFISDSCHSGTVAQLAITESNGDEGFFHSSEALLDQDGTPRFLRSVSLSAQERHYAQFRDTYNTIRNNLPDLTTGVVRACVIQFGACQDNQEAADGVRNGLFTSKLLQVWADGAFAGDYDEFFNAIVGLMPPQQQPGFLRVGVQNVAFEDQRPFSI